MAPTIVPGVRAALPTATLAQTLGVIAGVIPPTVARGVIIGRPPVETLAERLDRSAVRRLQRLRDRHGSGPLLLRLPVRRQAGASSSQRSTPDASRGSRHGRGAPLPGGAD